jgi:hypothetical protein
MAYQEALHEAQWSSSHGLMIPRNAAAVATYLPTPVFFTGVPVVPVQLLTQLLGFSVYCCFSEVRVFDLVLPKNFSTPPQRDLVFLLGVGEFCLCVCVLDYINKD